MILQTDKGNLFVQKSGQGLPLLLLHGNGEDSTIFQEIITYFEQTRTVYAMDTRGHGHSDLRVEQLTFAQIARDILLLMELEQIDTIDLIGFSDGGNIGLYVAAHYPEQVKSLITLGANYQEDGLIEETYQEMLRQKEEIEQMSDPIERQKKRCIHLLMLDELNLSEKDLKDIQAPVLVMAGEYDVIKQSHTEALAANIPGAELLFVPGGGHDFFVSQPRQLIEAATVFYKK
ncbi:alpha/beta fold hydrolase [Jeotgalibaca caeni]|uniref:alpha/beta fold hydrolase n=1 Tax=Jeotgalibaca caeni TaxID=3028623 RepID=UPI00237DD2FF|nr:alpha/beta hydrolase [Jeotgalibaca caeni]MDE1549036.1 alpha/beta hydrolase [Jeotgalibaca caeni]